MSKLLFRPLRLLAGVLGGLVAGAVFKQVWKLARHEEEAPEATDAARGWGEILLAAAVQGAIFAVVKAVVDRSAAVSAQKLTGNWPGKGAQPE